jgi:hypothetical protein
MQKNAAAYLSLILLPLLHLLHLLMPLPLPPLLFPFLPPLLPPLLLLLLAPGGLMSDATKLPVDQQAAAMASISAEGLPQAIERQAAAGAYLWLFYWVGEWEFGAGVKSGSWRSEYAVAAMALFPISAVYCAHFRYKSLSTFGSGVNVCGTRTLPVIWCLRLSVCLYRIDVTLRGVAEADSVVLGADGQSS